jgi:tellurite resistance protein TehA-like permease
METIDITSSEFSLENITNFNDVLSSSIKKYINFDYILYYIGIAILLLVVVFFVYKFYINKKIKHVTYQDKLDDYSVTGA